MQYAAVTESFPTSHRYYYARCPFNLDGGERGHLCLAAQQYALAWVNGVYLGRTYVHTHEDELRYETFDLTPHLRAGENVVALLLHGWGPPEEAIPGVFPVRPISFVCAGEAGTHDLSDLTYWRVAPADEYQPARRHNSLIGHEEDRDLRREPPGWREPGFDESTWISPTIRPLEGIAFLPSPLRPLREEVVYPARLVSQGRFIEGTALRATPPADAPYWRLEVDNEERARQFFFGNRVGSRLWIDGVEQHYPIEPPLPWVELYQPVTLSPGVHTLQGEQPLPYPLHFGWTEVPIGGDCVGWAITPDGPFTPGTTHPDPDYRPLTDAIDADVRCQLAAEGVIDLTVADEEYACILEFPRSMTLLPCLEIADATPGAQIELIYSERLSAVEGLTIPAAYTDCVTLRGGAQVYQVSFQYKSARILGVIVRARGGFVRLRRVSAIYRHYDYDAVGQFTTPDTRLNQAWEICRNTMEFGSQDFIMDGPWREQLLYIGDNYVHNQACYHLFGNHEIVEWQHTLYAQGQMADGLFQPNQPCRTAPDAYRLLDQVILWPIQLEHHLHYTGRRGFVMSLLPRIIRLLDGFQALFGREAEGDVRLRALTGWNWVDHAGLVDGQVETIRHDGIPTGINLFYLLALQSAIRLCEAAGDTATAARFRATAGQLSQQLRAHHWDAQRQVFADCVVDGAPSPEVSVHLNLLAILAGLAPDAGALLDRTWQQPGVLQMCGAFFRVHLLEVLHRLGRYDVLLAEIRDLWGGFVDAGLTSTPEYIPINGEWGASVGHPWGASPAIYLVKSLAGLSPISAGWQEILFAPHLGALPAVTVSVPTPYGPLHAELTQANGTVAGTLQVPPGITVRVADPEHCRDVRIIPTTESIMVEK